MIFHIARPVDIFGLIAAALEFVENGLVGLLQHIGQNVQAAAVGHAKIDLAHAQIAAALYDLLHRGDQGLGPVKAETLGAHVFDLQELLIAFRLDQLVEDGFAPLAGKAYFFAIAFDAFFQPTCLIGVRDMHILQRKGAAVGALYDFNDLAHRGHFQPQNHVDKNRAVHIGIGEAVRGGVKFGVMAAFDNAQRVKVGGKMAANTVGADQHDGAHRIQHCAANLGVGQGNTLFSRLFADLLARGLRLNRVFAGHGQG